MKIFPTPRNELDLFALYFLVSFVCMPLFLQLTFSIVAFVTPLRTNPFQLALSSPWVALSVLVGGISVIVKSQKMGITFKYLAEFRYWVYAVIGAISLHVINTQLRGESLSEFSPTLEASDPWRFMFLVLLAPIFEEYVFRGLLLSWLDKKYTPLFSGALTTLAFLLLHFQVFFGLYLDALAIFAVGIFLVILRIRSKALGPAMLAHCLNNGLSILI